MEPVYVVVANFIVFVLRIFYRFRAFGAEKVPRTGPAIIAPNHISNFDPLCIGLLVHSIMRRRVRFLAKSSLWKTWYLRFIFENAKQIPVERGSGDAAPLRAAEAALARGECVVIYPESTITTNIDLTPMEGKLGVARLALATGVPVYPVATWGPQWLLGKNRAWRYRGHRDIYFMVGDPMTFADLAGREDDREALREVTDAVTDELRRLVSELHKIHPDGGAVPPLKEGKA